MVSRGLILGVCGQGGGGCVDRAQDAHDDPWDTPGPLAMWFVDRVHGGDGWPLTASPAVLPPQRRLSAMDYRERITIDPAKRAGKPCIRGLRITVYEVLEYMGSGMSKDEILADFPDLEPDDLRACLLYAADQERKFSSIPQR